MLENENIVDNEGAEQMQQSEIIDEESQEELLPEQDLEYPAHWGEDLTGFIKGIQDVNGRRVFYDKFKNYENGYQAKFRDLAEQRKAFEADKDLLTNYKQFENNFDPQIKAQILSNYGNIGNYIQRLHQLDIQASTNPKKFLINYCQSLGISPENIAQVLQSDDYRNAQQQRQSESLKSELMRELESKFQAQNAERVLIDFANARNDNGELKHPYFKEVANIMDALANANPEADLEQLYDMAVYAVPSLRQQLQTQSQAVQKAKKAIGVKSVSNPSSITENRNWQDVLADSLGTDDDY
jgi:hypothetical protein